MPNLPDLGRSGIVNSVRKLNGFIVNPSRVVDPATEFVAGMAAKLVADVNGNPMVTRAGAGDTTLIGLFFCHKTTSFYRPIIAEAQTFGTAPNTATTVLLNHANVKTSYYQVCSSTGTPYTEGGGNDYTIDTTHGIVTRRVGGGITAGATVYVTYHFQDPNQYGIDQTLGSGQAATLEGIGEIATMIFDSSKVYILMNPIYVNGDGYLTSTPGGGSIVGKCTQIPNASNPELHVKLSL